MMSRKPKHYELVWSNSSLHVTGPPDRELTKALTYTSKSLEQVGWQRRTVKRRERIFSQQDNPDKTRTITTFQGVLDLVIQTIAINGHTFKLYDKRGKFPEPDLSRMHGFRFSQEKLLTDALKCNRSGLVVAPTRYGKTAMICNAINAFPGLKIAVIAPGIDLLPQLEDAIRFFCPDREIHGIYTGSKHRTPSDDVTVCSVDSIHKLDYQGTKLVLVDEPHAIATGPRSSALVQFANARFLGFGATVSGRWEGNDIMITGLFGPKLSEITYLSAVEEGAIAPIHVKFIKIPFKPFKVGTRATAYRRLFEHPTYLKAINDLANNVIPSDWQTLFFISKEKQGNVICEQVNDSVLAMDKLMKNKQARRQMFADLKSGDVTRCVCSNIYSTGVTIDGIRCAVNCAEGGGNILSIQKPGRLAELKDGKTAGYMIDFLFSPDASEDHIGSIPDNQKLWSLVVHDCWSRYNAYKEKGYKIDIIDNPKQIEELINLQ
jgi:superfamily II DNA or RNA helicase